MTSPVRRSVSVPGTIPSDVSTSENFEEPETNTCRRMRYLQRSPMTSSVRSMKHVTSRSPTAAFGLKLTGGFYASRRDRTRYPLRNSWRGSFTLLEDPHASLCALDVVPDASFLGPIRASLSAFNSSACQRAG